MEVTTGSYHREPTEYRADTRPVFFTSDLHFNHEAILRLGNGRPFGTIVGMNERLIRLWNATVSKQDVVYIVGDLGFGNRDALGSLVDRLQGEKHLVLGNHDRKNRMTHRTFSNGLLVHGDFAIVCCGGKNMLLIHDLSSMATPDFGLFDPKLLRGVDWIVCGHEHMGPTRGEFAFESGRIPFTNVAVDLWNFRPISLDAVLGKEPCQEGSGTRVSG
jgi:calcineurin-like phosphoesterase family protein